MNHPCTMGLLQMLLLGSAWGLSAATYYLDGSLGDDMNSGVAPDQAWRSLERVNREPFRTGDTILFKAGTRYAGQLAPSGSGSLSEGTVSPIRIGSYGHGPRPRIDGEGRFLDTLLLKDVEFWEVADLEITNEGERRAPWRTGIRVVTEDFGPMRHIVLSNLFVHDVNGDLRKSHEGCGIYFESRGGRQSRFEGLRIENCHVVRTDRNGICQRTDNDTRSTGVIIRGNRLEDIGGDGIKVWGSNGAVIEQNVVQGGRMRCPDHAAGIWPFDSDDTLIQFNEVTGMKGTQDGQGFDSDYRCRRSIFQYNYSHENEGGFMLICAPGHSYNEDTIIRYNISQNDGIHSARVFHVAGGPRNVKVYNNTIYIGPEQDLPLILFTEWDGGHAHHVSFLNNVFFVEGAVSYQMERAQHVVFDHNVFWGDHRSPPTDPNAFTNKPFMRNPGSGRLGVETLTGYVPRVDKPFPQGQAIEGNGGRDFFGRPVPEEDPPAVGAAEPPM